MLTKLMLTYAKKSLSLFKKMKAVLQVHVLSKLSPSLWKRRTEEQSILDWLKSLKKWMTSSTVNTSMLSIRWSPPFKPKSTLKSKLRSIECTTFRSEF